MLKAAVVLWVLPAILAGCLGDQPAASATGPTGQIDGAVVDHLLRPFANQTVTLVQLGRTDTTSPLGGFTFRDVPVGFYTLTTHIDGGPSATQVVDVAADKITRIILQLRPEEGPRLRIDAIGHQSESQVAYPNQECTVCGWSYALSTGERPAEVRLEATWPRSGVPLPGADTLHVTMTDEAGFPVFDGLLEPRQTIVLPGEDLPDQASSLQVHVSFGRDFAPRAAFEMESVLSLFYGATHDAMLKA